MKDRVTATCKVLAFPSEKHRQDKKVLRMRRVKSLSIPWLAHDWTATTLIHVHLSLCFKKIINSVLKSYSLPKLMVSPLFLLVIMQRGFVVQACGQPL